MKFRTTVFSDEGEALVIWSKKTDILGWGQKSPAEVSSGHYLGGGRGVCVCVCVCVSGIGDRKDKLPTFCFVVSFV